MSSFSNSLDKNLLFKSKINEKFHCVVAEQIAIHKPIWYIGAMIIRLPVIVIQIQHAHCFVN